MAKQKSNKIIYAIFKKVPDTKPQAWTFYQDFPGEGKCRNELKQLKKKEPGQFRMDAVINKSI